MESTYIKNDLLDCQLGTDGIAIITIHMRNQPTNLFSIAFIKSYLELARQLVEDKAVKGIIITSGHRDFMAGADLKFIANPPSDKLALFHDLMEAHRGFRQLEQSGKPFVAAINGTALGGGYELALTCHHRIALHQKHIKIGLPETQLGLLPGGGGTQRLSYLIGIPKAVSYILQAKKFNPTRAKEEGLIEELAANQEELIAKAKKWITDNAHTVQPWDDKGYKIPQGGLLSKSGAETMIGGIGNLRKKTHGNYPGAKYAMACVHDGMQLPIDRGLEIEARYFIKAFYSKEAQNLIRTGFFAINEAKKGKNKPQGYKSYQVKRLGILGAGMMGAGIAYVSAQAGMEVVLKDVNLNAANKGKEYSSRLLQKLVAKGKIKPEKTEALLQRIQPSEKIVDLAACDLVIEAVYENQALKAVVTKETEAILGQDKVFASNTSTIPISLLAQASERPANFIGLHFFSPVDKMPLVEIIVGEKTSQATIAASIDFVTQIGKVPIVVNDSRGFFTSRVFSTYTSEGALLLTEGVPAAVIENVAKRVGMPVGPLAVTDEVALSLCLHVMDAAGNEKDKATQKIYDLYHQLAVDLGRTGKKAAKGFYEYPATSKKHLWAGLKDICPAKENYLDPNLVGKRLLHIMALESYRCLEEGVLNNTTDGDVGSLLGFGFPPYTGGVFSYMDFVGLATFVAECDDFAKQFGARFMIPDSLRKMALEGRSFYGDNK